MLRLGRYYRGFRVFWILGAFRDGVLVVVVRRWRCGDIRVCSGISGSGRSGICEDRVGGWFVWGGGVERLFLDL